MPLYDPYNARETLNSSFDYSASESVGLIFKHTIQNLREQHTERPCVLRQTPVPHASFSVDLLPIGLPATELDGCTSTT
jgi:hypothetical protein